MAVASSTSASLDLELVAQRLGPLGSAVRLRLLRFLTQPHYLEEIASHLKMNRFAAKRHVDVLLRIGLIRSVAGHRESGPVRDYLVAPEAFFELYDAVRVVGELRPARDTFSGSLPAALNRTRVAPASADPGRARSPFPYFVVVYGAEIGRVHALVPRPEGTLRWGIGRDSKAEVPLETDPFVSNRHARISRHGSDYVLTDTYSSNGTWINWDRIPEGESATLEQGDVVGVGKTLLIFRRERP